MSEQTKERTVRVRVTEEQHDALQSVAQMYGYGTVSRMTRAAWAQLLRPVLDKAPQGGSDAQ